MRTRNHFCMGEGLKGFVSVLSGHYPAGKIAVLCDDFSMGQAVVKELLQEYDPVLLPLSQPGKRPEEVRFVVGIGDIKTILPVKKYAGEVKFAFWATSADFRFLNAFDGENRLAEFAYIDKNAAVVPSCYASLFCLWCEGYLRNYEESYLPYRNKILTGVLEGAERILSGECDKEDFLSEALRMISVLSGTLTCYKKLYTTALSGENPTPEKQVADAYFFTALVFNFTKIPFGVILNPSEEVKCRVLYDPKALPDREKTKGYLSRMKAMTTVPAPCPENLFAVLSRIQSKELPLLAALRERGLFKGWQDEKIKRDRGVSV